MAEGWYTIVNEELQFVDTVIKDEVRTAYPELNDMCEDTLSARNHELRPGLCLLSYYSNGGKDRKEAVNISACFQTVFDGLHLHDRVNGEGKVMVEKKRLFSKEPSTTKVIVAGDFMYVMGFRQAYANTPGLVPYLMKVSASISDGIFLIVDNERSGSLTEDICKEILDTKYAVEFQILMEAAAKIAGAKDEDVSRMNEIGLFLGRAIEIITELEDLFGSKDVRKPAMEMLIVGNPALPIFYAMQDAKVGSRVRDAFVNGSLSTKEASQIVSLMKETVAYARCKAIVDENVSKAKASIAELPDSEYKRALSAFTETLVL